MRWEFESDVLLKRIHSLTDKPLRGSYATEQTVQSMLNPLRRGDYGLDAWTVFNVAQEKLTRGGSRVISHAARNADYGGGTVRKARGISSLPEIVRINRKLWDLAAPQSDQTELMAAE